MEQHLILGMQPENTPAEKFAAISSELRVLEEIIVKLRQLEVDATEYACLKGIVVFKTGELLGVLYHLIDQKSL